MSDIELKMKKKFSEKFLGKTAIYVYYFQNRLAVLICYAMTTQQKECTSCGRVKDESDFYKGRSDCIACKTNRHEVRISKSYASYLRNVCTQSGSAVKAGKRTKALPWEITPQDLIHLWEKQDGRCAISGVYLTHHKDGSGKKEYNASIDRINGDKGYTPQNIQLVCYRINIMKHTLSEDMFYWWVKTINDFSCD